MMDFKQVELVKRMLEFWAVVSGKPCFHHSDPWSEPVGVDGHERKEQQTFAGLLKSPFGKDRDL
ncbi:hypothetical protein N9B94_02610 [Verrucomicrobia bacterium]|nr:hypothetical protein [Verrucomicrobiota bacterium]